VPEITFGFMDPERDAGQNADLFVRLRSCAIESFEREDVCSLQSFAGDSIQLSHDVLVKKVGVTIGELRDAFYAFVSREAIRIRFPDVQSFFLYSFTRGVNLFTPYLADPEDLSDVHPISVDEIIGRRFPIYGPDWVCLAANREMPSLENVFCDFQDNVLVPVGRSSSSASGRLTADVIAGIFLWGYFGGTYWLKEAVREIAEPYSLFGGETRAEVGAVCQVKRSMQFIGGEDLKRVLSFAPVLAQ
jgi:hypothetical protein